jgi:hypothetical protein
MTSRQLIEQLAANLEPVEPLRPFGRRAVLFMLGSSLYVVSLTLVLARPGLVGRGAELSLAAPQLAALVASLLAARAAFASVVPGFPKSALAWAALGAAAWIAALVAGALGPVPSLDTVLAARHEWSCVALILLGGAPLVAILAAMLRAGAPINPVVTAVLGALAVGSLANVAACFWTIHTDTMSALFWHGGAIVALLLACALGARFVLTWRRSIAPP